tara:strand:- start:2839 stop:3012 length:174 start_codon:yes stop_codon:yes gene_type:complete
MKESLMTEIQLARLDNDVAELQQYIDDVRATGNSNLAVKLEHKLSYLTGRIAERMAA